MSYTTHAVLNLTLTSPTPYRCVVNRSFTSSIWLCLELPCMRSKSKNALSVWAPLFQILDCTFYNLDCTIWLDSMLKITLNHLRVQYDYALFPHHSGRSARLLRAQWLGREGVNGIDTTWWRHRWRHGCWDRRQRCQWVSLRCYQWPSSWCLSLKTCRLRPTFCR